MKILQFLPLIFLLAGCQSRNTLLERYKTLNLEEYKNIRRYTSLEDAFKEPEEVIFLDLSGQGITTLPDSIGRLINLKVLKPGFAIKEATPKKTLRKATKIAGGIFYLDRMIEIYIGYNHIDSLPSSIVRLTSLEQLDLTYNQMKVIPWNLLQLPNLKTVNLVGNYPLFSQPEFDQFYCDLKTASTLIVEKKIKSCE